MAYTKKDSPTLFDDIAVSYDRVNRFMTFSLDTYWRSALYKHLPPHTELLLDGATGTADQILFLLNKGLKPQKIIGIDLSEKMLEIGKKKVASMGYQDLVSLEKASLLAIPYPENYFDAASVSFGVRNVEDLSGCLSELYRVLKKEGVLLILECSKPKNASLKCMHRLYMEYLMPLIGGLLSRNKKAYDYLHSTSSDFPYGEAFIQHLKNAGFNEVSSYPLSLGVVTLYVAKKG